MLRLSGFLFFWGWILLLPVSGLFLLFGVLFFWIVWILVFLLSLRMFLHCVWLVVYRLIVLFVKGMLFFLQWKRDWKVHIILYIYYFLHILFLYGQLGHSRVRNLNFNSPSFYTIPSTFNFWLLRHVYSSFLGSKCMLHFACGLSLNVPLIFIASFLSGMIGIIPFE